MDFLQFIINEIKNVIGFTINNPWVLIVAILLSIYLPMDLTRIDRRAFYVRFVGLIVIVIAASFLWDYMPF